MGFLAWLRKLQNALHQYSETTRIADKKENERCLLTQRPVEVHAVVSYDKDTVAEAKAQACRAQFTQNSIRKATWAGFWAVSVYALITLLMWCQMIRQNKIAYRSLQQSKNQWNTQNRPWVGPSAAIEFPKQPTFQVFTTRTPRYTSIELDTVVKIKNFGISPAFKSATGIEIKLADGDKLTAPQNEMKSACSFADGDGETGGSTIFPNGEITQSFEQVFGKPIELTKIRRVWVLACVSYQDAASNKLRHTKVWIVSFMIPNNAVPLVVRHEPRGPDMVNFYTLPINGWNLIKTEAD